MTTETFAHIPLAHIVASLTNPRRAFNPERLAELAESIRADGVDAPILLRPLPGSRVADTAHLDPRPEYELVSGERRYRASQMAGKDTIPAIIRALSDAQVKVKQLTENLQREDLQPLEEAEGYEQLMAADPLTGEPGLTVDEVANRVKKSRSYVYARLKLLNLCLEGKQAMADGWLEPSTALLVARMPSHKLQADALGNLKDWMGRVLSHRDASALIERQYMLKLGEAKFKITDATLVPDAGSCRQCPKRTGADPDLFADVKGADVCTDTACFRAKEAAHQERAMKAARESGAQIIEGREAKALVPHSWSTRIEGWLRLDDAADSPTDKPLRKLIGKQLEEEGITPTLVANPHNGEMVAVIDHATASRLLAKKGHQEQADALDKQATQSARAAEEAQKGKDKERFEKAWRMELVRTAWAKISTAGEGMYSVPDTIIRSLAVGHLPSNQDGCKELCKLLDLGKVAPTEALRQWIQDHPEPDRALALVLMYTDREWQHWKESEGNLRLIALATDTGVDVDVEAVKAQVKKEHTAEIKARNKVQAEKAAAEAKTPSPPLPSAAQAGGVRGEAGSKGKGKKGPAAPAAKKPKTSAREALQGIAAAMQGEGEEGAADAGRSDTDQDGASAVGEEGRATSPDAGAAQTGEAMFDHLGGIDFNSDAAKVAWPFPRNAAP